MVMNFIFEWSTRYLTRSLRSLMRYRVDYSKIKFISTRGHVISSISPLSMAMGRLFRGFPEHLIFTLIEEEGGGVVLSAKTQPSTT